MTIFVPGDPNPFGHIFPKSLYGPPVLNQSLKDLCSHDGPDYFKFLQSQGIRTTQDLLAHGQEHHPLPIYGIRGNPEVTVLGPIRGPAHRGRNETQGRRGTSSQTLTGNEKNRSRNPKVHSKGPRSSCRVPILAHKEDNRNMTVQSTYRKFGQQEGANVKVSPKNQGQGRSLVQVDDDEELHSQLSLIKEQGLSSFGGGYFSPGCLMNPEDEAGGSNYSKVSQGSGSDEQARARSPKDGPPTFFRKRSWSKSKGNKGKIPHKKQKTSLGFCGHRPPRPRSQSQPGLRTTLGTIGPMMNKGQDEVKNKKKGSGTIEGKSVGSGGGGLWKMLTSVGRDSSGKNKLASIGNGSGQRSTLSRLCKTQKRKDGAFFYGEDPEYSSKY